jgi:hypothetical protein
MRETRQTSEILSDLRKIAFDTSQANSGFIVNFRRSNLDTVSFDRFRAVLSELFESYEMNDYFEVTQRLHRIPYLMAVWADNFPKYSPDTDMNLVKDAIRLVEGDIDKIFKKYSLEG